MPIIATFSDGTVDVYKGRRLVKAAWQVTYADGTKSSGHSVDRATAERTAKTHARTYVPTGLESGRFDRPPARPHAGQLRYWNELARKYGHKDWKAAYQATQAAVDRAMLGVRIEVVDL